MAINFHPNVRNLIANKGLLAGFTSPCAISIYSGVQPTAADIKANWTNYNSAAANHLAHYIGASWWQPAGGIMLQLSMPPAVTPVRDGIAAWCILWSTNITKVQTDSVTLPSTLFVVGTVSDAIGSGVIRFENISLLTSVPKVITDGSITVNLA